MVDWLSVGCVRGHWWVVAVLWGLAGCAGELDDPDRFRESTCDPLALLQNSCGGGNCHDADNPAAGVDLETSGVVDRLLDVEANDCPGEILISTADPASSYMLTKLSMVPPCGGPMPPAALLPNEDESCLAQWVDSVVADAR